MAERRKKHDAATGPKPSPADQPGDPDKPENESPYYYDDAYGYCEYTGETDDDEPEEPA